MIAWLLARPRLIAYGLAGAAIVGAATVAWVKVHAWHSAYVERPAILAQRDAAVATVKLAGEASARNERITNDYHDQIDRLRADLRARPITVRVCADPAKAVLPARTAPRTDAPAPGPEPGPTAEAGRTVDLSPYAEDAAAVADQLMALQRWVSERP